MTTIACNRKMMAGDSLAVSGNTRSKAVKLYRVGDEIIGFAGDYQAGIAFVDWYKDKSKTKPDIENFSALVLSSKGITLYENMLIPLPVAEPFTAIGSGTDAALGAMHAGKSPDEAVKIACKVDAFSGLPVKVMCLEA